MITFLGYGILKNIHFRNSSSSDHFAVYASLSFVTNFPSGFTNSSVNTAVEALDRYGYVGANEQKFRAESLK